MNNDLIKRIGKAQILAEMNAEAKEEAYWNGIPYTPYPLRPWMEKRIKARFNTTGKRTGTQRSIPRGQL